MCLGGNGSVLTHAASGRLLEEDISMRTRIPRSVILRLGLGLGAASALVAGVSAETGCRSGDHQ